MLACLAVCLLAYLVVCLTVCLAVCLVACRDEAARIWAQREAEWARERVARERLMQEV